MSAKAGLEKSSQVKYKLALDLMTRMWRLTRSVKVDLGLLIDLKDQALSAAADLEKRLLEAPGDLDAYNAVLKNLLKQGELKGIFEEEMYVWTGSWDYIRYPGVPLATTLGVVTDDNGYSNDGPELPEDNMLFGWRTRRHEVMTSLARTYNTVLTSPEELHMQHLVWR